MYTLKEISAYFRITEQSMLTYVKNHIADINVDGQHATIKVGKWHFDEIAKMRLEKLRGFSDENGITFSKNPSALESLRKEILDFSVRLSDLENNFSERAKRAEFVLPENVRDSDGVSLADAFVKINDRLKNLENQVSQTKQEQKSNSFSVQFWFLFVLIVIQFLYFFTKL